MSSMDEWRQGNDKFPDVPFSHFSSTAFLKWCSSPPFLPQTSHSTTCFCLYIFSWENMDANESCIDMEVGSLTTIFSPSHHKEFEFQSFSCSSGRDTTTSPADELFYRGKLLPLNLPPCLQKVEKILHNSYSSTTFEPLQESLFSTPIFTPASNTPFESCHISPADSCQVSRELNPDEYFLEYSTDQSSTYVRYSSPSPYILLIVFIFNHVGFYPLTLETIHHYYLYNGRILLEYGLLVKNIKI